MDLHRLLLLSLCMQFGSFCILNIYAYLHSPTSSVQSSLPSFFVLPPTCHHPGLSHVPTLGDAHWLLPQWLSSPQIAAWPTPSPPSLKCVLVNKRMLC